MKPWTNTGYNLARCNERRLFQKYNGEVWTIPPGSFDNRLPNEGM